jgi:hypothetical protein
LKNDNPNLGTGTYVIDPLGDGVGFAVTCNMDFNDGGYTLALKIDGRNDAFSYSGSLWTSDGFDLDTGETATTAKLQAYLAVPLTEVVLVMDDQLAQPQLRFDYAVVVDAFASPSLQQLVTGPAQSVEDDFNRWRVVPNTNFQCGCNRLVVNSFGLRLGLVVDEDIDGAGNPAPSCDNPDSFVGIGGRCFEGVGASGNCSAGTPFETCSQEGPDEWRPRFAWVYVRSTDFSNQPPAASCDEHQARGRNISGRYRLSNGDIVSCTFP